VLSAEFGKRPAIPTAPEPCVCWSKMPISSIANITPSSGPTGGGLLVEISGTGFQLPPSPEASGLSTPPAPTVAVLVSFHLSAADPRVFAAACLTFLVPRRDTSAADIVVQNIDGAYVCVLFQRAITSPLVPRLESAHAMHPPERCLSIRALQSFGTAT
jgi:hypothetical protein